MPSGRPERDPAPKDSRFGRFSGVFKMKILFCFGTSLLRLILKRCAG